jgi:hypothetical protein
MRGAGWDQGIEKRFSMWARIWDPRPRSRRPPDRSWRSHAVSAVTIGVRANATTIEVPSSIVSEFCAAGTKGRKGSWFNSEDQMPSNPAASASVVSFAAASIRRLIPVSIFIRSLLRVSRLLVISTPPDRDGQAAPSAEMFARRGTARSLSYHLRILPAPSLIVTIQVSPGGASVDGGRR